ncbi:hypothetical protein OIE49_36190 [Streptomyces sp. NBC_01788]|uniref:hypothetical protein n=1 Tax=Streptomyces sp. NBC_01788 TaxID=2975940 RepID=UPI002DDC07B5|nr:hypothetical protein [Streptomyces sp. NBC_01788]WSB30847.1 hypothetical protein OIE49_36190 [Streptomyces sp. NBC_01788]
MTDTYRPAANCRYYQRCLPQKVAAIMANCPLPEVQPQWLPRIIHQGPPSGFRPRTAP